MGRGGLTAVTDAGPLIHLTEIGCLHILSIFGDLHVPEAVWAETVECGRTSSEDFLKLSKVERHNMPQSDITWFVEKNNLKDLHYILNLYEVSSLFVTKAIVEMAIELLQNPVSS